MTAYRIGQRLGIKYEFFFFQAEDGIRDWSVTGVQTCALPISAVVEIPGYARATVVLADRYPAAPAASLPPLANSRPTPFDARRMYDDRWMFHGPQYQGVTTLGPMGDDGVDGAIDVLPAPGALLDCAGQLMGWWVMHTEQRDRLAMPVKIDRIPLYAP